MTKYINLNGEPISQEALDMLEKALLQKQAYICQLAKWPSINCSEETVIQFRRDKNIVKRWRRYLHF